MAKVLMPGLYGAELFDLGQELPLHPEEERIVAGAALKRRRDFTLGRACAHAALAELDLDKGPIARAGNGAPVWPAGLVRNSTKLCAAAWCLLEARTPAADTSST